MFPRDCILMEKASVERMARILGAASAAQKALDDCNAREARGEKPLFLWSRKVKTLFVAA